MDNLTAAKTLCTAICSPFYPDVAVVEMALFNEGIDARAEATPKDANIFKVAVRLVMGFVEGSRSEGGISTSVLSADAIKQSISIWCGNYGLDAEEILSEYQTSIEDGSKLW